MDLDATTIAGLRKLSPHPIELWADKNHTVKAFTSSLYAMNLPKPLIEYFSSMFSGAIASNKGKPEELSKAFRSIVPHAFGDHSSCTFHDDKENYIYKKLPNKKPLEGRQLRISLEDLMSRFVLNVEKFAPAASTQGNESFNNTVASICPKSKHFSDSESFDYRVAAAVCRKNMGQTYLNHVYRKLKLSPLQNGGEFRKTLDAKKVKKNLFQSTREGKTRRKMQKNKRACKATSNEKKEGVTYESNIGLSAIDDPSVELPVCIPEPVIECEVSDLRIVYFDLETTGFGGREQICQISALYNLSIYNAYIVPSVPIKAKASLITGLIIKKGDLFLHDKKLDTVSRSAAGTSLIEFFEDIVRSSSQPCKILLVGHNVISFDCPKIEDFLRELDLYDRYSLVVHGYSDTLHIFKKSIPERTKEKKKFSVEALIKDYLPEEPTAGLHNAVEDIRILKKLVRKLGVTEDMIKDGCKSITFMNQTKSQKKVIDKNKATLQFLKKIVSARTIGKMASEGINKTILFHTHKKDKKNGVKLLLSTSVNKKVRVTSSQKIIEAICNKLDESIPLN